MEGMTIHVTAQVGVGLEVSSTPISPANWNRLRVVHDEYKTELDLLRGVTVEGIFAALGSLETSSSRFPGMKDSLSIKR